MKYFYDIHCHIMNLSHPNLSAIIKRLLKELPITIRVLISLGTLLYTIPFIGRFILSLFKFDNRIMNLLAIIETESGDYILQMEEDLCNNLKWSDGPILLDENEKKQQYDKLILTPLMIDFGFKSYEKSKTLYKVRWKPIASQVLDVCLGIKYYYQHRDHYTPPGCKNKKPLFEIFPFMGINTKNYEMKTKPDGTIGLKDLLFNHFNGFEKDTPKTRLEKIRKQNWRNFNGDIKTIKPYDFIGIKVYSPVGFNPWPIEHWEEERDKQIEKLKAFYEFCQSHKIPITSHCSDGGFLIDKRFLYLANPQKWATVLACYPDLRLNLAHFGADDKIWRKEIAQLILEYENVYTDIAYRGVKKGYYYKLREFISEFNPNEQKKLMSRIIFGSDFMINLMSIDSYSKYMENFAQTEAFTTDEKDGFCSQNPEKFLYIA